jgi:SAM-dependent methyltransferase
MHPSVMEWSSAVLDREWLEGASVLECGSLNVNGSVRDIVMERGAASYHGTDMRGGPGVDEVIDAANVTGEYDVVISTEMLEHAHEWADAVYAMKRAVRPGGRILITTRGPGFPRHAYPDDYWRFTTDDFARAFADFEVIALLDDTDRSSPGVFLLARRPLDGPVERPDFAVAPAPD